DQSPSCETGSSRKLEIDLGQIDDHAIGVRQGKGPKLDRLVEIENKAGLFGIAGQASVRGGREIRCRRRVGNGGRSLIKRCLIGGWWLISRRLGHAGADHPSA